MYFYIQIFQKYLPPTKCQTSFTFQFWTKKKWSFIRKYLQIKVSIQMKAMRSYNIWEFSLILNYPNSWTVAILDNEENRMHVQSSICSSCSTSCCSLFCLPWGEAKVILVVCGLTVPASSLCYSPLYESTVCMKMAAQDATGPNLHTWFHFAGWRLMGALLPHHTFAPHLCRQFVLKFWSPRGDW